MADPKVEIKIVIGEAERMTLTGKNLEKLTGRRMRALNINLRKKIREERAKALRAHRDKEVDKKQKQVEAEAIRAEEERQAQEAAKKTKSAVKLKLERGRIEKTIEAGTDSERDHVRLKEIEKELKALGVKEAQEKPEESEDNPSDDGENSPDEE